MDINRGEPGEVGHQMSRFTHPLRQTLFYEFIVMSQMLFYSLIKSLSGCSDGKRSNVFFCALNEAESCIAKREKWDSVGRSGKTWGETSHNLILGLKDCNNDVRKLIYP